MKEGGRIYGVNYINDDAPRAHIRGHIVSREDWYLYPPGDIQWRAPIAPTVPYEEWRQRMASQQYQKNQKRKKDKTR